MKTLLLALAFGLALPVAAHAAAPASKAKECCCKDMAKGKKMSCCNDMKKDAKVKAGSDPHAGHDMSKM